MNASGTSRRLGVFATVGSVASAIASSACCWLPLVLIAFGASAVGVASFFEKYRLVFLAMATFLLATGFYFNYFRQERCTPGSVCATPRPRLQRFNRITLWIATVFVVAFAFFPSYVGLVVGGASSELGQPVTGKVRTLQLAIGGMTCEGCAGILTKALADVPGVIGVKVSYEDRSAVVRVGGNAVVDPGTIEAAVNKAGYSNLSVSGSEHP